MNAWLDRYFTRREEALASLDDQFRESGPFRLGTFDGPPSGDFGSIAEMFDATNAVLQDPEDFFSTIQTNDSFRIEGDHLLFQSAYSDGTASDMVDVRLLSGNRRRSRAVIITPHWNAEAGSYVAMGKLLSRLGFYVCILNLPHHGRRSADGTQQRANSYLNADLGAAIRSVRQSVSDLRSVVHWLAGRGYEEVGLIGVSLGSCVSALATAFETRVARCALLLTAGDFGETVWTGRATAHIRETVEKEITLDQLREIWSVISPTSYIAQIARQRSRFLIVSGRRDRVVLPRLTAKFVDQLRSARVPVKWHALPCGHYTIATFPFNLVALGLVAQWQSSA